ncbi:putative transcriptional regulatory protein [Beauveria bassiana]|nr:putative transcriptional regulatory protein [Beauveria bassiana]
MSTDAEKAKTARRRRDKVQLSCNLCRKRKLRCNRVQPCWNCSSRGLASSCAFPDTSTVVPSAAPATAAAASFQDRINHLEGLVVQLLQQDPPSDTSIIPPQLCAKCTEPLAPAPVATTTTTTAVTSPLSLSSSSSLHAPDIGRLKIDSAKSAYRPLAAPTLGKRRFQLLFGGHRTHSLDDILGAMPAREVVDRLVLLYFNNMMLPRASTTTHTKFAIIHSGSFLRQYEKFWTSPHETPILWIAMLFGIMSVASQTEAAWALYSYRPPPSSFASSRSPSSSTPQPSLPLSSPFPLSTPPYVDQVVACLILGEYTKGGAYAIEALLHYQFIEVTSSADVHADAWLLSGIVTRLSYRMGYHRDPSHFPSLSAFQGETRRRLWITVHAMDTMISAQMGLPRLIKAGASDRPWTELTPTLHLIAKHRLFVVIGTITDFNMSVGPEGPAPTVAREKELTKLIQDTYDQLPDKCKFHSMLGCIADKAADIIHRIGASALLQKGLIAIYWHRLMARDARDEAEQLRDAVGDRAHVRQSYAMCIRAAVKVLGLQSIVESESKPGGGLFPQRIQASSVIKHEFLMSTVVLCRHMYRVLAGPFGSPLLEAVLERRSGGGHDYNEDNDADSAALPGPEVVEAALRHSHSIWQRGSAVSSEARRISSILDALFGKLGTKSPSPDESVPTLSSPFDGIDPGLALLDEFGLLHHLQDMNSCFDM